MTERFFEGRRWGLLLILVGFFMIGLLSKMPLNHQELYQEYRHYYIGPIFSKPGLNATLGSNSMYGGRKITVTPIILNTPNVTNEAENKGANIIGYFSGRNPEMMENVTKFDYAKQLSDIELIISNSLPAIGPWNTDISPDTVNNMYYIKIHKTGSTTLQSIIYRYGLERNLTFALFKCLYGMSFPSPAYSHYLKQPNTSYNIIAEHTVFKEDVVNSYMLPGTKIITQLRHPFKYLTSAFGFHNLYRAYDMIQEDPVAAFLRDPEKYDILAKWRVGKKCHHSIRPSFTKNAMAYHMGFLDQYQGSPQEINKFIHDLDHSLNFVLILEKFDESLILLKRIFKWTTKDIIYLPLWSLKFNKRKDFDKKWPEKKRYKLTQLHKTWAPVDYAIYEYYMKKLDATLAKQDRNYWDEVEDFKMIVAETKSFCLSMCAKMAPGHGFQKMIVKKQDALSYLESHNYTFPCNQWHAQITVTYVDCLKMVLGTMYYQQAIAARQIPTTCNMTLRAGYCRSNESIFYNFPWILVRRIVLRSQTECLKYVEG